MNLLWPLLAVAALAIAVVLLALARRPGPREPEPVAEPPPPPGEDIRRTLEGLHEELVGRASPDVMAAYEAIHRRMLTMLWRIQTDGPSQVVAILRRIAFDYLPRTTRSYLRVVQAGAADHPLAGGRTRPLAGGRTPRQAVLEQLGLIEARLAGIDEALNGDDVDRLLAHGHFLEVRFGADAEGARLFAPEHGR